MQQTSTDISFWLGEDVEVKTGDLGYLSLKDDRQEVTLWLPAFRGAVASDTDELELSARLLTEISEAALSLREQIQRSLDDRGKGEEE
jgi:hypothetical protein